MEIEREIVLPVPPEEAWEALTEPERLEEWFANEVELDARPGGDRRVPLGRRRRPPRGRRGRGGVGATRVALGRRRPGRADARRAPRGTRVRVRETAPEWGMALELQALAVCAST